MNPAIITAIITASGTVLAALIQLIRGQRSFRRESSTQHGVLLDMVEHIAMRTTDTFVTVCELKADLIDHIANHDAASKDASLVEFVAEIPPSKKPAKKAK